MGRYPFWKDQQIAFESMRASESERELTQLRRKLQNVKCPKCGHVFSLE